jgi:mannitol-1-phosphate/altronate dehydrogenase
MEKKILIYGAGAIGRGFVPWIFPPSEFEISYVESNPKIRDLLNQ